MKIPIEDKSDNGVVFVRGLYGPKTIQYYLDTINADIKAVNEKLRALLYE